MTPRWLNPVLAVAFAGSFVLMWASRRDVRQPNAEFLPDMAHAPRYGAFAQAAAVRVSKDERVEAGSIGDRAQFVPTRDRRRRETGLSRATRMAGWLWGRRRWRQQWGRM